MKPAVVLLSGGVDSATTLAITRNQGFLPYALSFAYGQRHSRACGRCDSGVLRKKGFAEANESRESR